SVETVSPVASTDARIEGVGKTIVNAFDTQTIDKVAHFDWKDGSNATLAPLGSEGAIAEAKCAQDNGISVGEIVAVQTPTGKRTTYPVLGTARDKPGLFVQSIALPRD